MYNTFNMGIGMVLAVDSADVEKTMKALEAAGETCYEIGKIEAGEKGADIMLRVGVLVSGGGTNLQAIIDGIKNKVITNTEIEVVISNKKDAYALVRAKENGINAECISPKDFDERKDI